MKRRIEIGILSIVLAAVLCISAFFAVRARFPRPYREAVRASKISPALIYGMMKAESGFDEHAESSAGAVGVMQLLPSTAKFICTREKILYDENRLYEGEYNTMIAALYVRYLFEKFPEEETMLAAYNAGEGTVSDWLSDENCSADGVTLRRIPYPETERYIKKVKKIKKIYEILY